MSSWYDRIDFPISHERGSGPEPAPTTKQHPLPWAGTPISHAIVNWNKPVHHLPPPRPTPRIPFHYATDSTGSESPSDFVQSSPEPEPETETESDVDGEPLHFTHLPPTLPPPSQVTTKSSRAAPKRSKPVAVRNKTKSAVKHTVRARSARGTVKQTVGVTPKRSTRRTATISTESSSDSSTHSGNAKTSTRRKYEIWEREVVAEQIAAFVQRHSRLPSHELVEWAVVRDMCREASKTKVVVIDKKTVIGPEFLKSAKGIQKYASRRKIVISQREKDLTAKAHSR